MIDTDNQPNNLGGTRCLVLGGGGFLGINLCNGLVRCGATVAALGRSLAWPHAFNPQVAWMQADLDDVSVLEGAVDGQDVVFHLASASIPVVSNQNPIADLEVNVRATVQLLEVCRGRNVGKLIFASSGGTVYGRPEVLPIPEYSNTEPISAYGISKLTSEKYLALYRHLHGLDYQILRVANAYGRYQTPRRGQGVVATMISRALNNEPLEIWGTGDVIRDFVHVDDVVTAMIAASTYEGSCKIMNVGSGSGLSINQIARDIENVVAGGPLLRCYKPAQGGDVPMNVLDTSVIERELGWRPRVPWPKGLNRTVSWLAAATSRRNGLALASRNITRIDAEKVAAFANRRG